MKAIELNTLLNKVLLEDTKQDLNEFLSKFQFSHCLVDGDGYSVELLYSKKNVAVYYYHRQKKEGYISILGIVDWKIEMLRFFVRIEQFFAIDLSHFEPRMISEIDTLIQDFGIE